MWQLTKCACHAHVLAWYSPQHFVSSYKSCRALCHLQKRRSSLTALPGQQLTPALPWIAIHDVKHVMHIGCQPEQFVRCVRPSCYLHLYHILLPGSALGPVAFHCFSTHPAPSLAPQLLQNSSSCCLQILGLRQIPTLNPQTWPLAFVQVTIMRPAHLSLVLLSATVQMVMNTVRVLFYLCRSSSCRQPLWTSPDICPKNVGRSCFFFSCCRSPSWCQPMWTSSCCQLLHM